MDKLFQAFVSMPDTYVYVYQTVLRILMPVLVFILLYRTVKPLVTFRREPEIWAWLCLSNGKKLPITHWESVIGRSKRSDVVVDVPTISRTHAVLTRYDDGSWTIADAGSKTGVAVNGETIEICPLHETDVITIGGVDMSLQPITRKQKIHLAQLRTKAANPITEVFNLLILTGIQALILVSYLMTADAQNYASIFLGFSGIALCQWALLVFYLLIRKASFELESIAFFLCTMGMAAICAVCPDETVKQLLAMILGLGIFLGIGWCVRDLERSKQFRYYAGILGIGLLIVTLLFGTEHYGAKNWIVIGSMSIQPSELSKVCFVFMGASTMDRIVNKRNILLFIVYTAAVCGCLAKMNDFGTALVFFVAFLLIAYLRSGSVGTIGLACTAVGFAGVMVSQIMPHVLDRFAIWRHIWEDTIDDGYQQARALMCVASGGLFGLGAGNGWMKNLAAADSDVVFATLSEEWGLLIPIMLTAAVVFIGLFALRTAAVARSSFYTIGACAASGILLTQTILNVLGSLDILPFTGVTMPFVSNGGSSMICAWGLLAFVKAADTRKNASFAVRQSKEGRRDDE